MNKKKRDELIRPIPEDDVIFIQAQFRAARDKTMELRRLTELTPYSLTLICGILRIRPVTLKDLPKVRNWNTVPSETHKQKHPQAHHDTSRRAACYDLIEAGFRNVDIAAKLGLTPTMVSRYRGDLKRANAETTGVLNNV